MLQFVKRYKVQKTKMLEFLLRLFCFVPIYLLLTSIGYNFNNINVAAFITDCGGNESFFLLYI